MQKTIRAHCPVWPVERLNRGTLNLWSVNIEGAEFASSGVVSNGHLYV